MASVSYHIANLLEKMTSSDKDFRFMATNDLMAELQKDSIKLDDDSERKVVKMLLKLLEDKNGEVQNLAVKCLGPLVNKVKEYQVETIVDTLCNNMVSEKEQLRDISSIGLKTVISELPPSSTGLVASICKKITGRLSNAIAKQEDVSVQLEALDILSDLLSRFGGLLISFHPSIQDALLPQLASPRLAVRKRSITAIGYLVMSCNQNLFNKLIDMLLDELSQNSTTSTTRTYIQCIAAISRQAGHRFGEHLERVMPLVVEYCAVDDDELREYCLQAFESFVRRCPKEITAHVNTIIKICLQYLCYDPNYNYDDDDGEDSMDMDRCDEEEGESEDEYSDDDDMSWKVRRASAKCLEAVIATRHEMLMEFYKTISPALVARFKEREENVKVDIFHSYIALLRQTKPSVPIIGMDVNMMEQEETPVQMLKSQTPAIVKALHRQLKEKSIKTRQGCFAVLSELVSVLPGALSDHIPSLIPGIQFSLGDKNTSSNMKIDTLAFLHCLLTYHNPEVFHPHIAALVPPIIHAVGDVFYKITSEALLVLQQLVKVIRPLDNKSSFNFSPFVPDLYQCTLVRLKAADIDQEVKERAISCMGQIICNLGDYLQAELQTCLPIFLDRLKNEITRLTTVKALTKVAGSPLKINLRPILGESMPILASFLRKNQRALKLGTLTLLDTLVKNYTESLTQDMINIIMLELPPLISESDLHISQLTMSLLTSISRVHQQPLMNVTDAILPEILVLVRSPLLQGAALNAMLEFFQALVTTRLPGLTYKELLRRLTAPIYVPNGQGQGTVAHSMHKQAYHSIAKCVAALTVTCPGEASAVVDQFLEELQEIALPLFRTFQDDSTNLPSTVLMKMKRDSDSVQLFALLAVGEIGKHIDLSSKLRLKGILLDAFTSQSEEVKTAASFALGSVAVGNLPEYLPFVLREIESQPKRQYLLLHSLKEIISCQSASPAMVKTLQPFVESVWNMLFNHCECTEEGTRNVVAECLGKLTLIDPPHLLPKLKTYLNAESPLARSTVVTAMKFTISDQPQPIDSLLRVTIGDFLKTLQDPDLNVRRVALVAFNSAAHNKPSLVRDLLDSILPQLYNETKVRVRVKAETTESQASFSSLELQAVMKFLFLHGKSAKDIHTEMSQTSGGKSILLSMCSMSEEVKGVKQKELIREVEMGPFKHTVDDGLDIRKAAFECMYTLLDSCLDRLDIFEFLNHVENGLRDHYDIKMLTYLMLVRLASLCPSAILQRLERLVEPLRTTCTSKVKANAVKQEFEKQDELKRSAMRAFTALLQIADADKNPLMNEFLAQIKSTPDLLVLFDSIQKDCSGAVTELSSLMDIS